MAMPVWAAARRAAARSLSPVTSIEVLPVRGVVRGGHGCGGFGAQPVGKAQHADRGAVAHDQVGRDRGGTDRGAVLVAVEEAGGGADRNRVAVDGGGDTDAGT